MPDNKEIKIKLKRVAMDISMEAHKELKVNAALRGVSIKEFIEEALCYYSDYVRKQ